MNTVEPPRTMSDRQLKMDRLWRGFRFERNGIVMPKITCRYHRTVLLKDWIESFSQ